jgi:uncharacterized protein (DUF2141 family)
MTIRILLACLTVATAAGAQVRDRPTAPMTGTASISGTVMTDAEPSRPVRRAAVTANSTDRTVARTALTDDSGRFSFTNLPAGRYSIDATKRGWVTASVGARAVGRPGRATNVAEGERTTVRLRMTRGGVITGTILDQNGQPPTGLVVRAMKYGYAFNTGERRLQPVTSTGWGPDDRGVYRIWGLAPGEYYVSVSAVGFIRQGRDLYLTSDLDVQEAMRAAQSPGTPVADVPRRTVGFAPVFYPGTAAVAQASPVVVRPGEERTGIDFSVQYVPTAHVEGTVSFPAGPLPAGTQVNLIANDPSAPVVGLEGLRMATIGPDGHFDFAEITPGAYVLASRASLRAAADAPQQVLSSIMDVEVQGEDVRGLQLALQDGLTVSGVVRIDGTTPPPAFSSMRATLTPVGSAISISSGGMTLTPDGRFTITGITPGRYRLQATAPGTPPRWTVRSSVIGGQDALDTPIDIRQSYSDAIITLTDRLADVSGRLDAGTASADYTMILFSTNQAHWSAPSRRVLTARTASDSTYTFRNVPPGEYLLAALDDVEQGEWNDPAFLQRLAATAMKITIAEGEKKTQDVRVGAGG